VKTKKLIKQALQHPELYTTIEVNFFKRWLQKKKQGRKTAKIQTDKG
jgi:hypothetical protein